MNQIAKIAIGVAAGIFLVVVLSCAGCGLLTSALAPGWNKAVAKSNREREEKLDRIKRQGDVISSNSSTDPNKHAQTGLTRSEMTTIGLYFDQKYPFWPLVYNPEFTFSRGYIRGKIVNYGTEPVRGVKVIFEIQNSNAERIDDAFDFISQIDAGQTWSYQAITLRRDAAKCRIRNVSFN